MNMKKVAILTSGGDAPGMNAAIRSIVRTAHQMGVESIGIEDGFAGLVEGRFRPLSCRDVGNTIHVAGTILGSARAPEFAQPEVQTKAVNNLKANGIDGVIVIGGNGSQQGGAALNKLGFPTMGVASTIDNDLLGTDQSIGFDSAVQVACEAIDRLRVTARSHHRAFIVEVMGRDCGELALHAGMAGGAEIILVPEQEADLKQVMVRLEDAKKRGKQQSIIVVAEGCVLNGEALFNALNELKPSFPIRLTKLGHTQRGGMPTATDRVLATQLGHHAVSHLVKNGSGGFVAGIQSGKLTLTHYADVTTGTRSIEPSLLALSELLAC